MTPLHYLASVALLVAVAAAKPKTQFSSQNSMPVLTAAENTFAEDMLPWQRERKLVWDDFQQEPVRGTDAVASTSTALGLSYQLKGGALTWHITCNFQKRKSWGLVKTPYILEHEQRHFDITELYARKLHKALLEYHFRRNSYKADINKIYADVVTAKEAFQAAYDRQTDHSRKKGLQRQWNEQIDLLLDDTEDLADYP